MAKDTIEVQIRLPKETSDEIKAVAKLAGLSVDSVIKLCMALEVRKWKRDQINAKADV